MEKILCYTSGSSKGDPGPAGIFVCITDARHETLEEREKSIGNASQSFAEYYAVMETMQMLLAMYAEDTKYLDVTIYLDGEATCGQLAFTLPVQDPALIPMFIEVHNMAVLHFPRLAFKLAAAV